VKQITAYEYEGIIFRSEQAVEEYKERQLAVARTDEILNVLENELFYEHLPKNLSDLSEILYDNHIPLMNLFISWYKQ
jgi:hypothetical protein